MAKRISPALLVAAAMFAACNRPEQRVPQIADICTLAARPGEFDGALVRVHAFVLADGHHASVLTDPRCPGRGLVLGQADGAEDRPAIRQLDDAIFRTVLVGTLDKEISGDFIGTFRWDPPRWWQRRRGVRGRPIRSLEVSDIIGLRVVRKPGWKEERDADGR